jgi:hypothetical protein
MVRKIANPQVEEGRWRRCWRMKRWTIRSRSVEGSANKSDSARLQFLDVVEQLACAKYLEELT